MDFRPALIVAMSSSSREYVPDELIGAPKSEYSASVRCIKRALLQGSGRVPAAIVAG